MVLWKHSKKPVRCKLSFMFEFLECELKEINEKTGALLFEPDTTINTHYAHVEFINDNCIGPQLPKNKIIHEFYKE